MKNPKISPEEYRSLLEKIELREIFLIESKSKLYEEYRVPNLELNIKDNNTFETSDNKLKVNCRYSFKAKGEDQPKPFIEIVAKFQLIYDISDNVEITNDFFEVYKEVSLDFIIWPYVREFVQNTVIRMNLPPLTLPMRKAIKG